MVSDKVVHSLLLNSEYLMALKVLCCKPLTLKCPFINGINERFGSKELDMCGMTCPILFFTTKPVDIGVMLGT